jgi:hypothetical protein
MKLASLTVPALLLVAVAPSMACRSQLDVVEAHEEGDGTVRSYRATIEQARTAAIEVLHDNGVEGIEEHPDHVIGTWGVQVVNWGSFLGVWFAPSADGSIQVKAINRRTYALQLATNLTETGFHEDLAKRLAERRRPHAAIPAAGSLLAGHEGACVHDSSGRALSRELRRSRG